MTMAPLFAILGEFSMMHWLVVLVIGILLFGKRLPDIGRTLGKSLVEFKKGMKGLEDNLDDTHATGPVHQNPVVEQIRPPQRVQATAPKFEDGPANVAPPHNAAPQV
jgi:sec-independent protein translocase protein TatA